MIRLFASTMAKGYPIYLGGGVLGETGELWKSQDRSGKVIVITDSNVAGLYLDRVRESLENSGFKSEAVVIEAGEESKSLDEARRLYSQLFKYGTRRSDSVCALGGGVVGDLAGFVASTYMRGIGLIQLPTTLLSQVDSSIGGKVGVNINEAKNYVGSFYQPDMVVVDPELLKTLAREQIVEGLAEVIKYALLSGEAFFGLLQTGYEKFVEPDLAALEPVIKDCIEYKINIVFEDEHDFGMRAVLNLGHTIGHGIEAAGRYEEYSHGQAVALGLIAAVWISEEVYALPSEWSGKLEALLEKLGLPARLERVDPKAVLGVMKSDKKADDISANMVLLSKPGSPVINCDVGDDLLRKTVARLAGGD